MVGIPKTAIIGTQTTWVDVFPGFSNVTHDLIWLFGTVQVIGTPQPSPQTGWTTSTDFSFATLGPLSWEVSARRKSDQVITEIANGSIFTETEEYNMLCQQKKAVSETILKILRGGGNQILSIKGRSSTKYSLTELKSLESELKTQLDRMLNPGASGRILVNFGRPY